MDESLMEQRRVNEEGLRVVKFLSEKNVRESNCSRIDGI